MEYLPEIQSVIIEGKNPERVSKWYNDSPKDWKAQYDMLLMDGFNCLDCSHCDRCVTLFDQKEKATSCQFYPSRFYPKKFVKCY